MSQEINIKDEQVRHLLRQLRIRQSDIAKAVGCDVALVSRVLREKRKRSKAHKQDKILPVAKKLIYLRLLQLKKQIRESEIK